MATALVVMIKPVYAVTADDRPTARYNDEVTFPRVGLKRPRTGAPAAMATTRVPKSTAGFAPIAKRSTSPHPSQEQRKK